MPVPIYNSSQDQSNNHASTGTAGHASIEIFSASNNSGGPRVDSGSIGGTVIDSGSSGVPNMDNDRSLSKEEADRLYEERMEEEYAKREGGA
ncbi:hypothetical protein BDV25DRAFT_164658 [Aspergillus avenaceus]|uniref:Uncharacterized protein n=1 Tax=Aspergillus avenaceus TaxID=36643 RepID=A0A5N6TGI2_ASPAV|nr:hypothetical protein BDV25DRAFT_164658 [Aspergillus avenaceus]